MSDAIYNFGELLLHPILETLASTPHAWLRDLLFTFNRGDLNAYSVLEANLSKAPLLNQHKEFLYQKISLSALTEAVFRRPPHDRAMTFHTISRETNVAPAEIEILIMKALSLGLLRGSIDQVAEIARINWVQPKVLDPGQIDGMRVRLREWDSSVNQLGNWIEGVGKDVWVSYIFRPMFHLRRNLNRGTVLRSEIIKRARLTSPQSSKRDILTWKSFRPLESRTMEAGRRDTSICRGIVAIVVQDTGYRTQCDGPNVNSE